MARALLISTYELGRQPVHVASPAGRLAAAGHEVRALDLSVESFDEERIGWADRVAISVPMHTAMRLGVGVADRIRALRPGIPLAFYGLYAATGRDRTVGRVADAAIVGEYEPGLVRWFDGGDDGIVTDLGVDRFVTPDRSVLPSLDRYAHLSIGGEHRLVGAVEASHGCRHRCRHCPIPAVYDGLFRIVGIDVLLDDIERLVASGAQHVTFADADFLNGPAHAMRVLDTIHDRFPTLTFDVTVKVEHLLRHRDLIPQMVRRNVLFAVSAFESTSDLVLERLDKGHSASDLDEVMALANDTGLDLHPSWLPFTPWTEPSDLVDIFSFLDRHDLFAVTDPVQLSIRLLIPDRSLVLSIPGMEGVIGPYDPEMLGHRWTSPVPGVDELAAQLALLAESGVASEEDPGTTLTRMWSAVRALRPVSEPVAIPAGAVDGRPRMTEPWFC